MEFEIKNQIAVVSKKPNGNELRLNLMVWNNSRPVYDLRWWGTDGIPLKGVCMNQSAMLKLIKILDDLDPELSI